MNIISSIGSFNPLHGGPFFSVGNLAKALSETDNSVKMLTSDYPHLPVQPAPAGITLKSISAKLMPGVRQSWIPGCKVWLNEQIEDFNPDIIHDNGLWLTLNHQVARAAQRHNIPLILSPRGCLDPFALSYRSWKKRFALGLYQRKDLESVTCFHAASELEAKSIRKMGLTQPIAVIPNGVDVPRWVEGDGGWEIEDGRSKIADGDENPNFQPAPSYPPRKGTRYALFMGRLHPIKNLPNLLRAWAEVKPEGWILRLVGSEEVGHRAELESLANELGIEDLVEFLGPIYGTEKEKLFRSSDLAFLVSKSENFGIAAAEALAAGVPVIASKTTPWSCLEDEKIGWWVDGTVEGITEALRDAINLDPEIEFEMHKKARCYAENTFGWSSIAERFIETYHWITDTGSQPDFVI